MSLVKYDSYGFKLCVSKYDGRIEVLPEMRWFQVRLGTLSGHLSHAVMLVDFSG